MRGKLPTPVPIKTKEVIAINKEMMNPLIGRKSCKTRGRGLSNRSCPSSKNVWQKVFPKSPSRTTLPQICPRQLWEAVTPKEMEAVELNDCQSMQFIHQPGLSTQIQVQVLALRHNLDQGLNQPTKLIPMQMHAALVTTLLSLNSQLDMSMFTPMMSPSSPFQMHQLHPGPLPGMIQLLDKHAFWSQTRRFIVAPNWTTPQSTPTKFAVLALIAGTTLSTLLGPCPLDLLNQASLSPSPQWEPKSNLHHGP